MTMKFQLSRLVWDVPGELFHIWDKVMQQEHLYAVRRLFLETLDRLHNYYTVLFVSWMATIMKSWLSLATAKPYAPHFVRYRTNYIPKAYWLTFLQREISPDELQNKMIYPYTFLGFNQH